MDASDLLQASGWQPGRSVDITADLEALTREGFVVSPAAEAFLRQYSHLIMQVPGKSNPMIVDGGVAARHAFVGWEEAYSAAIGKRLVPVGEYSNLLFWIDPDGDIWATFDDDYGRAGASLQEVLQGLFFDSPGWRLDRKVDLGREIQQ